MQHPAPLLSLPSSFCPVCARLPHRRQVDATKETELGTKHGVSGYPTIKWFVDGEVASDYSGPRDA